ncbi:MAG: methionyl-tRNA formyltransferase [Firmicutes bacterium]|nr:methionyl-tRNA formyltransferase [Candidatus Fiminaster equi]
MKSVSETRIVYMGTPEMSAQVLEALIQEGFNIVAVIAQEDRPVGRKAILTEVPTKVVAKQHNIPVYQPHKIRLDYEFVKDLKPDLILTMAYGQIVPQGLLDIPPMGALNLHGSILPKYRGAAPIQRAIMCGETYTGVTLMEMVDKMDAGKMYGVESCEILPEDNYTSLCEKIVKCAIEVTKKFLPVYIEGKLIGEEQDESKVTFADKILPETEKLSLDYDAKTFVNYVRGMSEEPGGYLILNDLKFKILKAKISDQKVDGPVGSLLVNKSVYLKLKDAVIELLEVQLSGKKKMDGKSFANGSKHLNGIILK